MNIVKRIIKNRFYYHRTGAVLRNPAEKFLKDKKDLLIAEIGVAKGINAMNMLKLLDVKRLFLIDPYTSFIEDSNDVVEDVTMHITDRNIAIGRLKRYKPIVGFIFEPSSVAVKDFRDNFLDFVYIDGNHSLAFEDMNLWYPKVKPGGLMAGHDVQHRKIFEGFIRFIKENSIKDYGIGDCIWQKHPDWWVIKNVRG